MNLDSFDNLASLRSSHEKSADPPEEKNNQT